MSQTGPVFTETPQDVLPAKVLALATALRLERRFDDAIVLFDHLLALDPDHEEALQGMVLALGAKGHTLEALHRLMAVKALRSDVGSLLSLIREQSIPAVAKFNAHVAAGEIDRAEQYAAVLAALVPNGEPMLNAALSCNQALGRGEEAARYARALLAINPDHPAARAALAEPVPQVAGDEVEQRVMQVLANDASQHPLVWLRDLHDEASAILCSPLTGSGPTQIERLLQAARSITVDAPPESEWKAWEKHYRLLMEAIDLPAVLGPTPDVSVDSDLTFATSSGAPLKGWSTVQELASRMGAQVVFFAAADEAYVNLYARWYALSVLKYSDVPCLVMIHVIGGNGRLKAIAKSVGIKDDRLVFAADGFDTDAVTTRCYDAPPKGMGARPLAHLQSVRFLRLGSLLRNLKAPVFVSDIDLLLQRGVQDLLQRCAEADVVLNENDASLNAGSRLTANLLLVNPTENASVFLRFLRGYLERVLAGSEVTRWIDQLALVLARQHLGLQGVSPRLEYFDTNSDINNVMYPSYQEHPFRFLSLFHGFDTTSLEDPRVLGGGAESAGKAAKAKRAGSAGKR